MRINNPILTILTCLVLSAMLILTNHLWDTQVATADGISPTSLQEGRFNPIQEEEEAEHEEEDEAREKMERSEHVSRASPASCSRSSFGTSASCPSLPAAKSTKTSPLS